MLRAIACTGIPDFLGTLERAPDPCREPPTSDERRPRPADPPGDGPEPTVDADDDVYVVDTRRSSRRRDGRAAATVGAAAGAAAGTAAARPAAGRWCVDGRPAVGDPGAYDEYGRPVRAAGTAAARAAPPRAPRPPRHRGRAAPSGCPTVVVVALLAWAAFIVVTPVHAWSQVTREDTTPTGDRPAAADGHTYLLVGYRQPRGAQQGAERKALGRRRRRERAAHRLDHPRAHPGRLRASRCSSRSRATATSPIPGHGKNKVNAAFAIGGPKLLAQTLEQATGLPIDGYVEIGFGGFAGVVDSLGGVDVCVKRDIKDAKAHIDLKKGCQTLDGKNALGYVRARYSDPKGDLGRAERQRQFLGAIMKKAARPVDRAHPHRAGGASPTRRPRASSSARTPPCSTRTGSCRRCARSPRTRPSASSCPLSSTNTSTPSGSSVIWDDDRAEALFTMLREGEPIEEPPAGTDGGPAAGDHARGPHPGRTPRDRR